MGKNIICLVVAVCMFFCAGCSAGSDSMSKEEKKAQEFATFISENIGVDSIQVEIDTSKGGDGKAAVTAYVPDYTEIFTEAFAQKNYEKALVEIINRKEYKTREYFGFGNVKEENGKTVLDDEELIKGFMEKELIKAINAVIDQEG